MDGLDLMQSLVYKRFAAKGPFSRHPLKSSLAETESPFSLDHMNAGPIGMLKLVHCTDLPVLSALRSTLSIPPKTI